MKNRLKRLGNRVAAATAPWLWRLHRERRLLVLMYHRVLPVEHPERAMEQPGMCVSPETLTMQLHTLSDLGFSIVHLQEWLEAAHAGQTPPGLNAAITFDDGWRDNHDYAFPVLKELRAPATIFIVSDLVGKSYSFWPNRLVRLLSEVGVDSMDPAPDWLRTLVRRIASRSSSSTLDHSQIDAIVNSCKRESDHQMLQIIDTCEHLIGLRSASERTLMDWQEIRQLHNSDIVRFGSHTRRHTRLPQLIDPTVLVDEIAGSSQIISSQLGVRPSLFCYPNGDNTPAIVAAVSEHYDAAVTVERDWYRASMDRYRIPRIGIHDGVGSNRTMFIARLGRG